MNLKREIFLFIMLTGLISWLFYYAIKLSGGYYLYTSLLMWAPGISAIIVLKVCRRSLLELGLQWGSTRLNAWAYLLPVLYVSIAYLITWITGLGEFNEKLAIETTNKMALGSLPIGISTFLYILIKGFFGASAFFIPALGEEIGWRGFLVPRLAKMTDYTGIALISGCIWAVWHYPLFDLPSFNDGISSWLWLICFTVMVISLGFILAWLRLKSGSIWPAVFLHTMHNLFIQHIYDPLTNDTGNTYLYSGETGIIIPGILVLLAWAHWRKRNELLYFVR